MLDRAVTLLVKNFVLLLLTVAIIEIPVAIVSTLMLPPSADYMRSFVTVLTHPSPLAMRALFIPTHHAPFGGRIATFVQCLIFILTPLSTAAVIASIGALYGGDRMSPAIAYRSVIRRWLQLVIVAIIYFLVWALVAGVMAIVFSFGALAISQAVRTGTGNVAFFIVVALFVLVMILLAMVPLAWLTLAKYFSYVELSLGESNPFTAVGKGFRNVLKRGFRVRSLVESIAVGAVFLGSWIISLSISLLLFDLGQQSFVIDVASTIISLITTLIALGFVTVAYFDTQARMKTV